MVFLKENSNRKTASSPLYLDSIKPFKPSITEMLNASSPCFPLPWTRLNVYMNSAFSWTLILWPAYHWANRLLYFLYELQLKKSWEENWAVRKLSGLQGFPHSSKHSHERSQTACKGSNPLLWAQESDFLVSQSTFCDMHLVARKHMLIILFRWSSLRYMSRTVVWAVGYLYSLVNVFIAWLQHLFDRVLWETCCLQFSRLSGLLCRLTDKINTQEYLVLKELSCSGELAHRS